MRAPSPNQTCILRHPGPILLRTDCRCRAEELSRLSKADWDGVALMLRTLLVLNFRLVIRVRRSVRVHNRGRNHHLVIFQVDQINLSFKQAFAKGLLAPP